MIDFAFTEDCFIKNPYLNPFSGRELLLTLYKHMLTIAPDFHLLFSKPELYHRAITVAVYVTGTTGKRTGLTPQEQKLDYLYNFFKCVPESRMDSKMLTMKVQYDRLLAENKLFRFEQKSTVFYILNEEKTHIEKRIVHNHFFNLITL